MVRPKGISTNPVWATFPAKAKVLVPGLVEVPKLRNQSVPFNMMFGTWDRVSTLLMIVGLPQRPETAGKGGRRRGIPRLPSIAEIIAVSSPQTKAPAPSMISMSHEKLLPMMLLPTKPSCFASSIARWKRDTARGYSARR